MKRPSAQKGKSVSGKQQGAPEKNVKKRPAAKHECQTNPSTADVETLLASAKASVLSASGNNGKSADFEDCLALAALQALVEKQEATNSS